MGADSWPEVRLGDLIEVKHGFPFEGSFFRDQPTPYFLLTPGNVAIGGGFQIKEGKEKYYGGPIEQDYVLAEGDLIVTMTDLSKQADTLGFPAFVPHVAGTTFLHNQRLGKVLLRKGARTDLRFLYYAMCSVDYRAEILAGATGTTVKHTAPSRIESYRFRLPPPARQAAVSSLLGALDDKIQLNRRLNRTLMELSRSLFRSWFVDFDPVHAKRDRRRPIGVPEPAVALFPQQLRDSELGPIPAGWKVVPLDTICAFLNGLALQNYPAKEGLDLPVIKIAQLRAGSPEAAERASADIPREYVIDDGDVVFSWSGSLLVDLWCGGPGALNQHLFKVTSTTHPKWFFLQWIKEHLGEFQAIAADKATTMGHIRRHHLTDAKVVVPSGDLLAVLSRLQDPLVERVVASRIENRTLVRVRDTLLGPLLSGEITIKQAEKAVAQVA